MQPAHKDFVVSLSFLNYLKEKTGMPKVMLEHQQMYLRQGISYIGLFSVKKSLLDDRWMPFCKFGMIIDGTFRGIFQMSQVINMMVDWCANGHRIADLHIHHLLYMQLKRVDELLDCFAPTPIKVFLHDYHSCCSNFNLMKDQTVFCGGKGLCPEFCADCSSYRKSQRIQKPIMQLYRKYLRRITFVSPSNAAKAIFLNFHPEFTDRTIVIPHQIFEKNHRENLETVAPDEKIRVAYLGMPVFHKGWQTWSKLVSQADPAQFEFIVFNSTDDQYDGMGKVKIAFSEKSINAMTQALREQKIHLAVLWSMCAETYSYTCFEAYAANAMLLTCPDSGNIADMVTHYGCGQVLESEDALLELFQDPTALRHLINDYRARTPGGPEEMRENPQITQLSMSYNTDAPASTYKTCKKPVNYPFLYILNKLYGSK